tara:strand:- start:116 stop:904 length:789 start_codon:yes stop_codon:yes gene_type:complete
MKELLLVGYGIVGTAVYEGLGPDNRVQILDPDKDFTLEDDYSDYSYYDGIILCLPTPKGAQGECDDMMVEQYIHEIRLAAPYVPILIKSTISIELVELLEDDVKLTYNPEFLTENNSSEEFQHQKFAIFGGHQSAFWNSIFVNSGIKIDKVRFTSMKNAAFTKYAINSFLATKVIFFNELKGLYNKSNTRITDSEFDSLTELISLDERIGDSHMMVPGSDMEYGFGGMCLPKDTLAFATSASRAGSPLKLLEEAILINNELR